MVSFVQGLILSIVQGITEWFPISSSGHLAVAENLLGVHDLGFIVYLHFASVLAVIILFWNDIIDLIVKKQYKYMIRILIAIVPIGIIGYLLKEHVRESFSNILFIGIFFVIFGVFVYATKFAKERKKFPSKSDSAYIGISQIFALFPGVSRSGMAMGSGLILGLKKDEAIKFSFLIAIPIIFGASLLEARDIAMANVGALTFLTSFTVTLFTSLVTINLLIKIIKHNKFYYFGIYNFILGIILIIWGLFF